MADPNASLADVITTPRLWIGPSRPPNFEAEMMAMRRLADLRAESPTDIFRACAEAALELCRAHTSGVRLCTRSDDGQEVFRWVAVAGQLKSHLLEMPAPKDLSPSTICVVTGGPLLLDRPERVFKFLESPSPFARALLVPLVDPGSDLVGTIWAVSHTDDFEFDGEDARVLQRIALFAATLVHMVRMTDQARGLAEANRLAFDELDHRMKNALQITANLLEMNMNTINEPAARAAIASARQRLLTMGQIHHIGADIEAEDLARVVRAVCDDLIGVHPGCGFAVEAPEILTVPAHKAALAALIVNELVTNSMKHAFRDRTGGTVTVAVHRSERDQVELSVADNGVPLPPDFSVEGASGHGLKLVRGLSRQLGGEFTVDVPAKRFSIKFASGPDGLPPPA